MDRCSFCDAAATRGPIASPGSLYVCEACTRLISALAARGGSEATRGIWPIDRVSPAGATLADFRQFQAELAAQGIDDAESRINLAIAYREMGLNCDAVIEAAFVMAIDLHGPHTTEALRILLTPPTLQRGGLALLRDRLRLRLVTH